MLAKYYDIVGAGIAPTIRKTVYDDASPDGRDATREGAFGVLSKLRFDVNVHRRLGASGVVLRIAKDGQQYGDIPLEIGEYCDGADNYSVTLDLRELCGDDGSGLFYYEFLFLRGWNTLFTDSLNNVDFELSETSENRFRLLVYSDDYRVPDWFGKNIIYHIFVDRFAKSRDNFTVRDVFGIDLNDKVVVAKDKDGKLYATSKSIAGSGLLDPYKLYRRVDVEEVNGDYKFIKSC